MKTRRKFLEIAALAGGGALVAGATAPKRTPTPAPFALARPMIKPRALKAGDTVGLIAPSSYIFDTWRLEETVARLDSALGLKSKLGRFVKARHGYMAGTETERLEDLHAMFYDPAVAAVFCLGGGYGTERLLDKIDYELIRKNPKILLGYSDITGLHLAITKKAGVVTFHGPVAAGSFPRWPVGRVRQGL